jgi:hypothetical protein
MLRSVKRDVPQFGLAGFDVEQIEEEVQERDLHLTAKKA